MGSLGIPPIVHHLYDFGNMPVFVAFGCKYHKNEVLDDGTVVRRKYIDYTVNTDERICDGFYTPPRSSISSACSPTPSSWTSPRLSSTTTWTELPEYRKFSRPSEPLWRAAFSAVPSFSRGDFLFFTNCFRKFT